MKHKPKRAQPAAQPASGWSRRSALTAGAAIILLAITLATCHLAPSESRRPSRWSAADSLFAGTSPAGMPLLDVKIADKAYQLEVALKPSARRQGLSDRKRIASDGGMLFVFARAAEKTFVMRRCLVPIDLIFLDGQGRIMNMHAMKVEPYDQPEWELTRYPSAGPTQFAVELAGGSIERLGLERGQVIDLPRRDLIAAAW